jgi:hypothetical protein
LCGAVYIHIHNADLAEDAVMSKRLTRRKEGSTTPSAIEREITTVTGTIRKRTEPMDKYLERVFGAVEAQSDIEWRELSESAQRWFNAAVIASDEGKPIPNFTADIDIDMDTHTDVDTDTDSNIHKAPVSEPITEASLALDVDSGRGENEDDDDGDEEAFRAPPSALESWRSSGATHRASMREALKRLVVRRPMASVYELQRQLDQIGYKVTTNSIVAIRSDTRTTLRVLIDEGFLKDIKL